MLSLLDKLHNRGSNDQLTEEDIAQVHDMLMVEYGWIPLEEFRKLPFYTLINLVYAITDRKERDKKAMEKKG